VPRPAPRYTVRAGLAAGWITGSFLWPHAARAAMEEIPLLPEEPPQIDKRYTAVMERIQPGYVSPDIPLGTLTLSPSMAIKGGYDDNIFATESGRVADGFARFMPQAALHTNGSQSVWTLDGRAQIDRYAHRTTEDIADYAITASGITKIDHATTLRAAIRVESEHQSRLSQDIFAFTLKPIRYTEQSGSLGITRDWGKFRASGEARLIRYNYRDGRLADGSVYDQQPSDNTSYRVGVKLSYAQTPALAWFLNASYNNRNFRTGTVQTPERDSHGYQVLGGVDFEPTALIRGSIGIGYLKQNFRLPFYRNLGGLAYNARIQFFPSQLTTVTLKGQRSVLDSGIPGSGGYLSTEGSIQVDHEWLRQLILSASFGLQHNKFNNLDRVDNRKAVMGQASYKMNRYASIDLRYDRLDQSSHGADRYRAYVDNRFLVGVTLRR
jgi:hypothetical protein